MNHLVSGAWPARILAFCAFLILPLAVVFPLMTTWLAAGAALACLPHLLVRRPRLAGAPWLLVIAAIALLGWAAVSSSWSVMPEHSLGKAVDLAIIAAGGTILLLAALSVGEKERAWIGFGFLAGFAIAAALVAIEVATSGALADAMLEPASERVSALSHLNRAASLLAIFSWVAAACLWHRASRVAVACLLAATLVLLLFLDPTTPVLAFVVGGIVCTIASWRAHAARCFLLAALLVLFAAAPFAGTASAYAARMLNSFSVTDTTAWHRIEIWRFAAERTRERPLTGWGLDAARAVPGGEARVGDRPDHLRNPYATNLPLHPHNATLQLWLELGLPGAALGTLVAGLAIAGTARLRSSAAPAVFGGVAAAAVVAEMSYGIWQGWWLAALWMLAAFAIAGPRRDAEA